MLMTMQLLKPMTREVMKRAKQDLVREKHLSPVIFAFSEDLSVFEYILVDLSTPASISRTERYLRRYVLKNKVEAIFIIGEGWREELTTTKKDGTKMIDVMHTSFSVVAASPAAVYGLIYDVNRDMKGKITFTNRQEMRNIRNFRLIHNLWGKVQ